MKSQLRIVGLGGSLSQHSNSLAALKIALAGAAEAGAKTERLEIASTYLTGKLVGLISTVLANTPSRFWREAGQ